MGNTSRLALPYPELSDPADVPQDIKDLALALDGTVMYGQGVLANRPTSSVGTPGKQGRFYWATDEARLYYDTGTSWVAINLSAVADGPTTQATLRSLGTGPQQAAAGDDPRFGAQSTTLDNSVTLAKLNTTLKPSTGAGASAEAVRALGTGAGMAAPGLHASQHAAGGSDPITLTRQQIPIVPVVTSLPASGAFDGQEVDLSFTGTDLTGRTYWRFKWVAAEPGSYKWLFIGGGAMTMAYPPDFGNFNTTGYTTIPGGPALALPAKGVYEIQWGCQVYSNAAHGERLQMMVSGPGLPTSQGDRDALAFSGASPAAFTTATGARAHVFTVTSAGVIDTIYRSTGASVWSIVQKWIKATPVRCAG